MSVQLFYPHPESQQRLRDGPLAHDIDAFAAWLAEEGYACSTARKKLQFAADLSRWLEFHELAVEDLDCERVAVARATLFARADIPTAIAPGTARFPVAPERRPPTVR